MTRASLFSCLLIAGCTEWLDLGSDRPDGQAPPVDMAAAGRCDAGKVDCAGDCAELQSSLVHCGRCDNACVLGSEICLLGTCVPCALGLNCDNACVHPYDDPVHCGNCTTRCAMGMTCMNGKCK